MKRLYILAALLGLVTISAFAQDAVQGGDQPDQTLDQTQTEPAPQAQVRQQLQTRLADLYLSNFREQVELTDEQILKLGPDIRQFIQMRFRLANRRRLLDQRQEQLLSQPNPSREDVQKLTEQRAQLENEAAMLETRFLRRHQGELSERQQLLVPVFNRKFFNERLPKLLEQARVTASNNKALRQQQRSPEAARPDRVGNPARERVPARPGNTFGGKRQR